MFEIPKIGLGTYKSIDENKLSEAIKYSIEECGCRHIDTAPVYNNLKIIGKSLNEIFQKGIIKREEIWITSKLWNTKHHPNLIEKTCLQILEELQLKYLDLLLIHWPIAFQSREDDEMLPKDSQGNIIIEHIDIIDTWNSMEELVEKKLVKHIGVSNFAITHLERMRYSSKIKIQPYLNQVELHLYNQQHPLIDYCNKRNIFITAYTCLGRSSLIGPKGYSLLEDPILLEISKEINKSPSQIALRFLLYLSPFINIIPKSETPKYIKLNFDLNFELSNIQIEKLKKNEFNFNFINPFNNWKIDVLNLGL